MKLKKLALGLIPLTFISCGGGSSPCTFFSASDEKFDEPYYQFAWHFNENYNTFKSCFKIDNNSHINIEDAWDITKGVYTVGSNQGQSVKIAVIDDNFDIYHEDLKNSIIASYDIDDSDSDVSPDNNKESHGTAVASFMTSTINNKGLMGAAPEAKLITIKQFDNNDAKTIAAFEYAKQQGAKVVNCSWGTASGPSQIVSAKIQELKDAGITVVFASGNEDKDLDAAGVNDESELDSVIGVGASSFDNDIALYSNYGSEIDIIAPGGERLTTRGSGVLGAYVLNDEDNPKTQGISNIDSSKYSFTQGTSFSAPIVSGVIALMISVNPKLTPDEIRTILIETADKINESGSNVTYTDLPNDGTTSTFNNYRAYGKINAYKAVKKAQDQYTP